MGAYTMKNLKISKKLFISYAITLLLLIFSMIFSILTLNNLGSQVETFYNGPFTVKGSASIIDAKFEQMQKSVYRAISNTDSTITQEAISDAKNAAIVIQEHLPIVKEHFLGDQQIVTNLENALSELAPMREHVLELASTNQNTVAARYMEENNIPMIHKAQAELDTLIENANQKGEDLIASLRNLQAVSLIILLILCACSIIISMSFAVYITRSVTKPVADIKKAAADLANGQLDTSISYTSRDELGDLANSMRTTITNLKAYIQDIGAGLAKLSKGDLNVTPSIEYKGDFEALRDSIQALTDSFNNTLSQINQASDQVAGGSDQVSNGAQALSQGATQQASSIEELAATITEISGQIQQNAVNAEEASKIARETGNQMTESNHKMQEMIQAMRHISDSSNEISKIIKTIEDIAFQTNILALNAAVEAARAGTAGKGFAVVADEVRNLASKSAAASKDTAALIETSIQSVQTGTKIADDTAQSILLAVDGAKNAVEKIDMISRASNEQSSAVTQVTQGVDQISAVVQTNSATAEQSAAASEELSGQAQILKDLVGQFKLKGVNSADVAYSQPVPEQRRLPVKLSAGEKY